MDIFKITSNEAYWLIPMALYVTIDNSKKEMFLLGETVRAFNDDSFDGDFNKLLDRYIELMGVYDEDFIIRHSIELIPEKDYKKLFIYCVEGVFCDGIVRDYERVRIMDIANQMNIDNDFALKVLEISDEKYITQE